MFRAPPPTNIWRLDGRGARRTCLDCLPRVLTRLIVSYLHILTEKTHATDAGDPICKYQLCSPSPGRQPFIDHANLEIQNVITEINCRPILITTFGYCVYGNLVEPNGKINNVRFSITLSKYPLKISWLYEVGRYHLLFRKHDTRPSLSFQFIYS